MKMFLIQSETLHENFSDFLAKGIGISKEKINEFYDGNSIAINKHYFTNFYNYYLNEYGDMERFIKELENGNAQLIDEMFLKHQIGIFIYNVLN